MIEIFAIDIEESISNEIYKDIFGIISEKRKENAKKYRFEVDVKRSVYAGALVRYLICSKLNISNEDIHISNNKYDKPYIENISNQYFNVSHSGKWVVCGWAQQEIGVDVEIIRDIDIDSVRYIFDELEYESIMSKNSEEQKQLFYEYWTLKESYIKYKGSGLNIPLNSFKFKFLDEMVILMSKENVKPRFYRYDIDSNHKLAVCTVDSESSGIIKISLKTIWNRFYN